MLEKQHGVTFTWNNAAFDTLFSSLRSGRYDIIYGATNDTAERGLPHLRRQPSRCLRPARGPGVLSKPKNPTTPSRPPEITAGDIRDTAELLWRIHKTSGPHPSKWNEYRAHGPLRQMRWDPHPLPAGSYPDRGVIYASTDLRTAVAEGRIDPYTGEPYVTTFIPRRPLRLLKMYSTDAA